MHDSTIIPFEGHSIPTYELEGQHAWLARDIGRALGYGREGRRLVGMITERWASEFIEGHDYLLLTGEELAGLRLEDDALDSVRSSLLVLFKPGVFLALAKTSKPAGKRLRRFLVDEVLPQLASTGQYLPESEEEPEPGVAPELEAEDQVIDLGAWPEHEPYLSTERLREERLALRVDLDDRKLKVATLLRAADTLRELGSLGDMGFAMAQVSAVEIALGEMPWFMVPRPLLALVLGQGLAASSAAPSTDSDLREAA